MKLLSCIGSVSWLCACIVLADGAKPEQVNLQDGQVLQAMLLNLLADPDFAMPGCVTNGATVILHARTPQKTGFLQAIQIQSDMGDLHVPSDAELDLRRRNSQPNSKPDTYDAVAVSFTNFAFEPGITVADLTNVWSDRRSFGKFQKTYPKARGWVEAYLPGYSKDGTLAIVRANVGPTDHGATVTALLKKVGNKWIVKWHHFAWYA